jgi:hypothetical protein
MKLKTINPSFRDLVASTKVDSDGVGWVSQRLLAEMCGVTHPAIQKVLDNLGGLPDVQKDIQIINLGGLPKSKFISDTLASKIINHYALSGKKEAIQTTIVLTSAGLRLFLQQTHQYNQPKNGLKSLPPTQKLKPGQYLNPDNSHTLTDQQFTTILGFCNNDKSKAHKLFMKLVAAQEINATHAIKKVTNYQIPKDDFAYYKSQSTTGTLLFSVEWLQDFLINNP